MQYIRHVLLYFVDFCCQVQMIMSVAIVDLCNRRTNWILKEHDQLNKIALIGIVRVKISTT